MTPLKLPPLVPCARCGAPQLPLGMRATRAGPLCYDCWRAIRRRLYEHGTQRRGYRDPSRRRRWTG